MRVAKTKALISFGNCEADLRLFSPMQIVGFSHEAAHYMNDQAQ